MADLSLKYIDLIRGFVHVAVSDVVRNALHCVKELFKRMRWLAYTPVIGATLQNIKRVMPCLAAVVEALLSTGKSARFVLLQEVG